jgi:hypothetical protein
MRFPKSDAAYSLDVKAPPGLKVAPKKLTNAPGIDTRIMPNTRHTAALMTIILL